MSTIISNLPLYVGAPQPTGFIPISIGGITYKIDPSLIGIPITQQKSDWNATSGVTQILNKPTIPARTSQLANDGSDTNNPFVSLLDIQQYKSANFTAQNGVYYIVGGTGTVVTDPTTAIIGKGYIVFVLRGTSVVGGVTWVDLSLIYRYYSSAGWASKDITNQVELSNIYTSLAGKQDTLGYVPLNRNGDVISGDIGNTSAGFFRTPAGTTAQRPSTALDGMIRYNTTTLRTEFYANASWQNHARLSGDTFTGNIFASNLSGTNTGDQDITNLMVKPTLTSGFVPKATGASTLANSLIQDNGTTIGIGAISTLNRFTLIDTVLAGSSSLAGSLLDLQQTWNTTGSPTSIKLTVTNSASGTASQLLDFIVGSTSVFSVDKFGNIGQISRIGQINSNRISIITNSITATQSILSGSSFTLSTGASRSFLSTDSFIASSGSATFTFLEYSGAINQTSTANGIIRGLYFNPTLTSLLGELRALDLQAGKVVFSATNTASGTTGAQTINKISGKVNAAAATTSLVVTNNLVTTASIVMVQIGTNDATCVIKSVVEANGSFTINYIAPTAETVLKFKVIN